MVCYIFTSCCILLVVRLVKSQHLSAHKSCKNSHFDNVYKTENQLRITQQRNILFCFTSCIDDSDCMSFAFNSNSSRCQIFNRTFRGQNVSGISLLGISHYDLVNDDCEFEGSLENASAVDCSGIQALGYTRSGVYTISISGITTQVWCDLQTDGGRWTAFQRRTDGSVNFDVGWEQYKNGFGNPSTEYWIGNDALHSLTNSGLNELFILIETWSGVWTHARYANFMVNDMNDKYRLTFSEYSGTAGDSFSQSKNQQFSTFDQDNDALVEDACNPTYHSGGWWYRDCTYVDLNGFYYNTSVSTPNSCHWRGRESLKTVFMMVR